MEYKAYKFKLLPTDEQKEILVQWVGCGRFIWNKMLEANIEQYKIDKKFIWSRSFHHITVELKKEHEWLKDVPSQALQQKCIDLDKSLKMCSSKQAHQAGFPKFKSKHKGNQSIRIPQQFDQIKLAKEKIKIPKIGDVKWRKHRNISGKLKSITIKKEGVNWFVVCLCEVNEKIEHIFDKQDCVGIDLGVASFATLSDGSKIEPPKFYKASEQKLKSAQRKLSRKQKGSNNYKKQKAKLAKIHIKIKNQRHNFIHQESNSIAKKYMGVFVEDLNIEQMKRKMGKAISEQGWAAFIHALAYKCNHLSKIDRFAPSTQYCHCCDVKNKVSLVVRNLPCCGMDRDLNASINILNWGYDGNILNTAGTAGSACGCEQIDNSEMDNQYVASEARIISIIG